MLYLFYGPDELALAEAVASLRARISPDVLNLNSATLDGRRLNLDELALASEAIPFLAERRLVVVHDALKHLKSSKERDALRNLLTHIPPTCDLVFVEGEDVDRRTAIYSYLKKEGEVREFALRQGAELLAWLGEQATALGVQLERNAAQRLVDYVGNESRMLKTDLDKVASYVGQGGTVTTRVIDLLVPDQHEHNLFAFIDSLSQRQRRAALQGIRALLAEGQPAPYILFMLARQVRILIGVRELATQRKPPNDIASHLRQKPFVVRKALEQGKQFAAGELETLHDRLLELDRATKTGRVAAEVALDMLVMEVCEGRQVR